MNRPPGTVATAIGHVVDTLIADTGSAKTVDHLLIVADALDEFAREQHVSGFTLGSQLSKAEAIRLRDEAARRTREQRTVRNARNIIRAIFTRTRHPKPSPEAPVTRSPHDP